MNRESKIPTILYRVCATVCSYLIYVGHCYQWQSMAVSMLICSLADRDDHRHGSTCFRWSPAVGVGTGLLRQPL